jgi:Glycosyl transferase 4-like domain
MAADVLYVTFDGVLQPLAFSQVVRVVAGLGQRGLRYHLLSVERPADLEDPARAKAVNDLLRPAGVTWTAIAGESMRTPRRAARMLAAVTVRAGAVARREGVRLVHARGYHSALIAGALKRLAGVPYLFDTRGYWIEERSGPGAWFSSSTTYAVGKFVEQNLFRAADAVVTLTDLQALDVASGLFGPPPRLLEVIPTCADYEVFHLREARPAKPDGGSAVPDAIQRRLGGNVVLGVVGALNGTYFVKETLRLARLATQRNAATHLLVLSAQTREYEQAVREAGLSPEQFTVASAEHTNMPEWLQWIDWGMLLVPETAANRAKMPTKLAEFFATGVRPLFHGCNSDAARWVQRAASGHVLRAVEEAELRSAAAVISDSPPDVERLRAARLVTAPHFSLTSGLDRYERLVGACLSLDGRRGARTSQIHGSSTRGRLGLRVAPHAPFEEFSH